MYSDPNHHLTDDLLHEYLDGELNSQVASLVQQHLDGCRECAARLQAWRCLFRDIDGLPELEQSVDFEPIVLARLPQLREGWSWTLWLQIGQAVLALGLTIFGWFRLSSDIPAEAISGWLRLPFHLFNQMLKGLTSSVGESMNQLLSWTPSGSDLIANVPKIPIGGTLLIYAGGLMILLWIACNHYLLRINGQTKDTRY
jgi:predicted anti-sigma-YlaC factor YlaD